MTAAESIHLVDTEGRAVGVDPDEIEAWRVLVQAIHLFFADVDNGGEGGWPGSISLTILARRSSCFQQAMLVPPLMK